MDKVVIGAGTFMLGKAIAPGVVLPLLFLALGVVALIVVAGVAKKKGLFPSSPSAMQKLTPLQTNPLAHLLAEAAASKFDSAGKAIGNTILNGVLTSIGLGALTTPADALAGVLESRLASRLNLGTPATQDTAQSGVKPIVIPGGLSIGEQIKHLLAQQSP
jgi:hypothetical protein